MNDYIVVGLGLAGIAFCEELLRNDKKFVVFEDASQKSSTVAGGMYNPVILKRFTAVWQAQEQLTKLKPFYASLEAKLKLLLDHQIPIHRRFTSVEEQNLWFDAMDKQALIPFLCEKMLVNTNENIEANHGYGHVRHTGRVDTKLLLANYREYLSKSEMLIAETFDHQLIEFEEGSVSYKGLKSKKIVFCEGYGLKSNPYFSYLPLNGTKGELLTIKAPKLKLDVVIKSSVFIIPLGNDLFRVGATYKWKDKTNVPTKEAKEELLTKLKSFLKCKFEVVEHVAGIRPTVTDRRPLVGKHPKHSQLAVLNGMGSRGVMIAPTIAKALFLHLEENEMLDEEIDIKRFEKKHFFAN